MTNAEREIGRAIGEYDAAVAAKDIGGLMARYAADVVLFDTGGRITLAEYRRVWEEHCFAPPGALAIERREMRVVAGGEVGCAHCYGCLRAEWESEQCWGRSTACYRKVGGVWLIAHEHTSFPFDFAAQKRIPLSF